MPNIQSPNLPNPKEQKKQIKQLQQDKKTVDDLTKQIQDSISQVNKNLENTFGEKGAKLVCLLRLDMVADRLDNSGYPKLAQLIDGIANDLEKIEV
jgi:hypothetical protein